MYGSRVFLMTKLRFLALLTAVQMRGLSRAFTACIQSMEADVMAQSRQSLHCSQTRCWIF